MAADTLYAMKSLDFHILFIIPSLFVQLVLSMCELFMIIARYWELGVTKVVWGGASPVGSWLDLYDLNFHYLVNIK